MMDQNVKATCILNTTVDKGVLLEENKVTLKSSQHCDRLFDIKTQTKPEEANKLRSDAVDRMSFRTGSETI